MGAKVGGCGGRRHKHEGGRLWRRWNGGEGDGFMGHKRKRHGNKGKISVHLENLSLFEKEGWLTKQDVLTKITGLLTKTTLLTIPYLLNL